MKLAIRELRNNPLWSILGLIICFICFNTVFTSLTNIGASVYQRKEFEDNINIDLNNINQLYFNNIEENEDQNRDDPIGSFHTTTSSSPPPKRFIMPVHTNTSSISTRLRAAPRLGLLPCLN